MAKKPVALAIYPHREELRIFDDMPPLGLAWIAAVLRREGYGVHIIDQQVDDTDIISLVEELKPALILISGTSHTRFTSFEIAAGIKEVYTPATVVYGGPHASFTAEDTLSHINNIDIIVHGEGEFPSLDLIRWKEAGGNKNELSAIKGISYRENDKVVTTGWRPFVRDLDSLPEPARDLLPMKKYRMDLEYLGLPATSLITARGCPVGCSYCSASHMFGLNYANRSPKLVVDEIEGLINTYAIQGFKIFDSTFTINKNHVTGFCDELERRSLVMPWECEVRVGSVDQPLLERMKRAGCYYIDIGVESGDQYVLNEMGKQITVERAEQLLNVADELGVWTKVFFTIGHINESYEAGKKTLGFIKNNQKKIKLIGMNSSIRIYPGTKVEEYAWENDLMPNGLSWTTPYENQDNIKIFRPVDDIPMLLQPQMGIKELRRLRIRYIIMRILSISYITSKLTHLLRYKQFKAFLLMILSSFFKRKK